MAGLGSRVRQTALSRVVFLISVHQLLYILQLGRITKEAAPSSVSAVPASGCVSATGAGRVWVPLQERMVLGVDHRSTLAEKNRNKYHSRETNDREP